MQGSTGDQVLKCRKASDPRYYFLPVFSILADICFFSNTFWCINRLISVAKCDAPFYYK